VVGDDVSGAWVGVGEGDDETGAWVCVWVGGRVGSGLIVTESFVWSLEAVPCKISCQLSRVASLSLRIINFQVPTGL